MDASEFYVYIVLVILFLLEPKKITVFHVPLNICLCLEYQDRDFRVLKCKWMPVFTMSMAWPESQAPPASAWENQGLL